MFLLLQYTSFCLILFVFVVQYTSFCLILLAGMFWLDPPGDAIHICQLKLCICFAHAQKFSLLFCQVYGWKVLPFMFINWNFVFILCLPRTSLFFSVKFMGGKFYPSSLSTETLQNPSLVIYQHVIRMF